MELANLLASCVAVAEAERRNAEAQLKEGLEKEFAKYLHGLCSIVANEELSKFPVDVRKMASVVVKNQLDVREKSDQYTNDMKQKWGNIDGNVRDSIKQMLTITLQSPQKSARTGAAEVISKIATLEIPSGLWSDLVPQLCKNVTENSPLQLKQSSLVALGYTCEELESEHLDKFCNTILTAVVHGMQQPFNPECDVVLSATNALLNSINFAHGIFNNETESDFIMNVILTTCTQGPTPEIKTKAMECLVEVSSLYYSKLPRYIEGILKVTGGAIKTDTEETEYMVAMQAIEVWSTICDEEINLIEMNEEGEIDDPSFKCYHFIRGVLTLLVPLLLECLLKQDEHQEDVSWNISIAAGTCINLLSMCVEKEIFPLIMPFVRDYHSNPEWRFREASILAFGSILNCQDSSFVSSFLREMLPIVVDRLEDPHHLVKDSAAWTISRACEYHPRQISPHLPQLCPRLLKCLGDTPQVAAHCAWSIRNIALDETIFLPEELMGIIKALFAAADREDANESNLRTSAYQAIEELINSSPEQPDEMMGQMTQYVMNKLQETFSRQSILQRDELSELQSHLCAVLEALIRRLKEKIAPLSDNLMNLFLTVLNQNQSSVNEDAMMAIGALCNVIENKFSAYVRAFHPFVCVGLRRYTEKMGCVVSIGLVGDLCRALESGMEEYCEEIVQLLLMALQSPELEMEVKPSIFSCFGDIALAIGGKFEPYLERVFNGIRGAIEVRIDESDQEMYDILCKLRESIFDAFTGVIQGFKSDGGADRILPYLGIIVEYVASMANDENLPEDVLQAAVGVVGDVADAFGRNPEVINALKQPPLQRLLSKCQQSDNKKIRDTFHWVVSLIPKN